MGNLIDPKERLLLIILLVLATAVWGILIFVTKGVFLAVIPVMYLLTTLIQSGFISYLRGAGAIVSKVQYPDLYEHYSECCRKLKMKKEPVLVIINGNGILNAFATKFLRTHYVVLYSNIVDAMDDHPEAIKFYMGHELGHISRKHLLWMPYFAPVSFLPLIGAAYSRARERTCDNYGLYCCASKDDAVRGMAALVVGVKRWKTLNIDALVMQAQAMRGFWMSYHELISDYPWTVRRLLSLHGEETRKKIPRRSIFVWPFVLITPRLNLMSIMILYIAIIGGAEYAKFNKTLTGLPEAQIQNSSQGSKRYGEPENFDQWLIEEP